MESTIRYAIYSKHKSFKRGRFDGVSTDDFERAKRVVEHMRNSRYAKLCYDWIKIKDIITNKYIYEVRP